MSAPVPSDGPSGGAPSGGARMRVLSPALAVLLVFAAAALLVLVLLGNWQVRRLAWKQDLIATIEDRRAGPVVDVFDLIDRWSKSGDVAYQPVAAEGRFGEREALVVATRQGEVGWHVLAPLELGDGRTVVVNRGFVPDRLRAASSRDPVPEGPVRIEGLARNPVSVKPNAFVPDNDGETFYWKEFPALARALGIENASAVAFLVDAGPTPPGTWPSGGVTIIDLPNNHFGYAVTWYGIAVALIGVVAALLAKRLRRVREARARGMVLGGRDTGA